MCGIAGIYTGLASNREGLKKASHSMLSSIAHRGPDGSGKWIKEEKGVLFCHRRLSIVDISRTGDQPMRSSSGRYVIVFNGEIYNHKEIRQDLEKARYPWRGTSDTETLLGAIETWGVERALKNTVGMFALALYDISEDVLYLARDRYGEKPIYYGWISGGGSDIDKEGSPVFAFASELKALRSLPSFSNPICRDALKQYLRHHYVPSPLSIYSDIYKLEPGCLMAIKGAPARRAPGSAITECNPYLNMSVVRWWSHSRALEKGLRNKLKDINEATISLDDTLTKAVSRQLDADVPVGAFLSGGIDSSTVVALMQKLGRKEGRDPVDTFTVSFDEQEYDESAHAKAVADHLGTRHHEIRMSAAEAQGVVSLLPTIYDEPFADSSQIPTYLLCKGVSTSFKVALSGDGADELFCGYSRYTEGLAIWNRLKWLPYGSRVRVGELIKKVSVEKLNKAGKVVSRPQLGDRLYRLAEKLEHTRDVDQLIRNNIPILPDPAGLIREANDQNESSFLTREYPSFIKEHSLSPQEIMMWIDAQTYLPDDILCKVDRAAMACSLETRTPFLDQSVVDLSCRVPKEFMRKKKENKYILRGVLYQYVPESLVNRPKMGFSVPLARWLRGELKDWADTLLSKERLESEGVFDGSAVRSLWKEHKNGSRDWSSTLWAILMFQAWLDSI